MNLINLESNYDPKWFFIIAIHDELRGNDRIVFMIFFTKLVKTEILTLYATTFEPIKIQKRSAPQNDCLNLSFVKDTYVDGGKVARMVVKLQFSCLKFWLPASKLDSKVKLYIFRCLIN